MRRVVSVLAIASMASGCGLLLGAGDDVPSRRDDDAGATDAALLDVAIGADAGTDAEPASADAETSDASVAPGCLAWWDPLPTFGVPERLTVLEVAVQERDPVLSADGLTLYFAVELATGDFEPYLATRPSRAEPFGAPVPLGAPFASAMSDSRLTMTADGTYAVLSRWSPEAVDLFHTERASTADPWPELTRMAISTVEAEYDPVLSSDGLRLFFSPSVAASGQVIALSVRASRADPFDPPVVLESLVTPATPSIADPAPTEDGRILLFSTVESGVPPTDIHYAVWDGSAFLPMGAVTPDLARPGSQDSDPFVSADGCEVFVALGDPGMPHTHIHRLSVSP